MWPFNTKKIQSAEDTALSELQDISIVRQTATAVWAQARIIDTELHVNFVRSSYSAAEAVCRNKNSVAPNWYPLYARHDGKPVEVTYSCLHLFVDPEGIASGMREYLTPDHISQLVTYALTPKEVRPPVNIIPRCDTCQFSCLAGLGLRCKCNKHDFDTDYGRSCPDFKCGLKALQMAIAVAIAKKKRSTAKLSEPSTADNTTKAPAAALEKKEEDK